jgi:hypothetical protein
VLSLPIPLRLLLAAQPELVTPVLQVVQRLVTRHLLERAGLKANEGHGCIAAAVGKLGLCDAVNHVAVDGVQLLASQMRIQPAQLGLVFFCSGLVCLFVTPTDHGVVSGTPNDVAQHALPPRLGLQSIAQAPTAGMQRRVSLTLC